MTGSVYSVLIELVIFVAAGIFFRKVNILKEDMSQKLSDFLLHFVLTFSLIASSQSDFKSSAVHGIIISMGVSVLYYAVSFLIVRLIIPHLIKDREARPISYDLVLFANVGFLGFAVIAPIFGENGTLYTISHNFIFSLFFYTIGMDVVEGSVTSVKEMIHPRKVFSNRLILICLASIVLYVMPFRFPTVINTAFSTIGNMMTPLSFIIVGLQIGSMHFSELAKEKGVISLSLVRMLLLPAVFFIILLLLPLDHEVKGVALIMTSMPSGSLPAVIAEKYHRKPVLASSVVALTTILYFFLLPLDIYLIRFL